MAWYIRSVLCDDEKYSPRFYFQNQSDYWAIFEPLRHGRLIDPVPELVGRRGGDHDYVSGPPPDFLTMSSQHVASDGFRRVVEELEPGLHQFIPVALFNRDDTPVGRPFWLLNPQTAMDVELKSARIDELRLAGRAPSREEALDLYGSGYTYAERAAIEGRHFWRTRNTFKMELYFSDELVRRVRLARLRKLTLRRVIEV